MEFFKRIEREIDVVCMIELFKMRQLEALNSQLGSSSDKRIIDVTMEAAQLMESLGKAINGLTTIVTPSMHMAGNW